METPIAAPDLIEPLLGFRAWVLGPHGSLEAITAQTSWNPGENVARCPTDAHAEPAPGRECVCGLYGLHDVNDPRLNPTFYVVGAIAAWGELEVYETGFRAEKAMVLALSYHPKLSKGSGRRLKMASEIYDVRVLKHDRLVDYALGFAQPLATEYLPGGKGAPLGTYAPGSPNRSAARRKPPPKSQPVSSIKAPYGGPARHLSARSAQPRGIWITQHVWARPTRSGKRTRIGITPAFAALIGPGATSRIELTAIGAEVKRGEVIGVIRTPEGPLAIRSPYAGWIAAHNPALPTLTSTRRSPTGSGWILAITPDPDADEPALASGPHGEASYESYVRRLGGDRALIESLRPELAWPPTAVPLDPGRRRPFEDQAAIEAALGTVLEERLDADVCRALAGFAERVIFDVRDPECGLTIRSLGGVEGIGEVVSVEAKPGPATGTPEEIRLGLDGEQLHRLFRGELDLSRALPAGEVELLGGEVGDAILALSVLRRVFPAYVERSDLILAKRQRGLESLREMRARRGRQNRGRMSA